MPVLLSSEEPGETPGGNSNNSSVPGNNNLGGSGTNTSVVNIGDNRQPAFWFGMQGVTAILMIFMGVQKKRSK